MTATEPASSCSARHTPTWRSAAGLTLVYGTCRDADMGGVETETTVAPLDSSTIYLRMNMADGARASFEYSSDDKTYHPAGSSFIANPGVWIGAKLGLFAQGK